MPRVAAVICAVGSIRLASARTTATSQALDHSLYNEMKRNEMKITWARAHNKTHMKTCNQDYCYLFWFVPRLEFVFSFGSFMRLNKCDFTRSIFLSISWLWLSSFFSVGVQFFCSLFSRQTKWIYCYRSYSLIISELKIVHNSWHGIKTDQCHAEKSCHQSEWLMDFV